MNTTGQQWFMFFLLTYGTGSIPPPDNKYLATDNADQFITDSGDNFLTDQGQ